MEINWEQLWLEAKRGSVLEKRPEDLGFRVDPMDVKIPRTARTKTVLGYLKYGRCDDRRNFVLRGAKTGVKEE